MSDIRINDHAHTYRPSSLEVSSMKKSL